jgi:hypothetical protein
MTARPSTFISHSVDKVINRTWHHQFHCCRDRGDRQKWNFEIASDRALND